MWHLLATVAEWFLMWFAIGTAFLLLWAGLAWVAERLGFKPARWVREELEDARRRETQLDLAWCQICGTTGGDHAPSCAAVVAARSYRAEKR